MGNRIAAFFDFDRTLIDVNSGRLWVRAERRAGRLNAWQMLVAASFFLRYHLSMIDLEGAMEKALATVRGQPEQVLADRTAAWYRDEVRAHVLPAAVEAIESHRERGHLVALLTTSSPYLGRAVQDDLGLDDFGATAYEVDDAGLFTGRIVRPACAAVGKIHHALKIGSRHGVDVDASYFYTDSFTDRAMLDKVRHPRIVNPDPRLRRLARARGWPILDWSRD